MANFKATLRQLGVRNARQASEDWPETQEGVKAALAALGVSENLDTLAQAVYALRPGQPTAPTDPIALMSWSNLALVQLYNPKQQDLVYNELQRRWQNKPVIAFTRDGKPAADQSDQYMQELLDGEDPLVWVMVDDYQSRLFPVGQTPGNIKKEDPLAPGKSLRGEDERSSVYGFAYQGVSHEARQFLRVMLELYNQGQRQGLPNMGDTFAIEKLLDLARQGLDVLQQRFPQVNLVFTDRQRRQNLPSLVIEANQGGSQTGERPFGVKDERPSMGSSTGLSPAKQEELQDALLASFNRGGLEQVTYFGLGIRWNEIVGGGNLRDQVHELVEWLVNHDKVVEFVKKAREENPGNPKLRAFAESFNQGGTGEIKFILTKQVQFSGPFYKAMLELFPSLDELSSFMRFTFNQNLAAIANTATLSTAVSDVLTWACSRGYEERLKDAIKPRINDHDRVKQSLINAGVISIG